MPDPTDPRLAALQNVQDTSRAYGRGRRRREDANVDPEFRAALEITDPQARQAAIAQYARQRGQALFASPSGPPSGASIVGQAFPNQNAFRGVGTPPPSAASVLGQVDPDAEDEAYERADDMRLDARDAQPDTSERDRVMYEDILKMAPDAMSGYQNIPSVGAEDSPEQFNARQVAGKQILARRMRR